MITKIIGKKKNIAIEYNVENDESVIGRAILWVKNKPLGSLYDTIFFESYLLTGLMEILNKSDLRIKYQHEDYNVIYDRLEYDIIHGDDDSYSLATSYKVNFGSWSDYFDIYAYKVSDFEGVLLWRLTDENTNMADLIGCDNIIIAETIRYADLLLVINDFNELFLRS